MLPEKDYEQFSGANCPAMRGIEAQIARADEIKCGASKESYRQEYESKKRNLEVFLGKNVCEHINNPPGMTEDVPRMGEEWCEFVNQCPIYKENKGEVNGRQEISA